ncbi:UDP-glucose 4-epimerase family protein [Vibrio coralliilyticus]|uniref:UDP-glucose 4-epimerase family protein n=1 Tax=Vibrio coralliilyticus TaxID=190893 RepID=UPI001E5F4159|nr:SDR family oxidoreductase [Vibrio coralliilyticus]MCC2524557.1 SDR family oxidoreductase [Vibrio coralliilyticus]
MKILLTGATGFVGSSFKKQCNENIVSVLRAKNSNPNTITVESINASTDWSEVLSCINVVVHCAGITSTENQVRETCDEVNHLGSLNLAQQAAEAGVKRLIFISTIKVNGESTALDNPFTHQDQHNPQDDYSQSKSEAEVKLLELAEKTGLEVVIIRPTLVYGPGVRANFASLMSLVSKGIPLPIGCIKDNRRSLVSVSNLVDLIVTCIDHPKAANQIFLVSDDYDVSTSEMVAQMAKALDKPQWQLPIPKWCYTLAGKILCKQNVVDRLLGSLQVDITHTKETLDWKPPQTLEDGFKQTAQAFLQSKQKQK